MLRKTLGVFAILVLLSGERAFSGGWPAGSPASAQPGCARCGGAAASGLGEESPLYPELTHWTLERSQCRRPHIQGLFSFCNRDTEVQYFPPLPYSYRANGYTGPGSLIAPAQPAATTAAPGPAAAPSPPAAPAQPAAAPAQPPAAARSSTPPPPPTPSGVPPLPSGSGSVFDDH